MDPKTVQLALFVEQMVALAAKYALELRGLIQGSSTKAIDDLLNDADAEYQLVIANAKGTPPTQ